MTNIEETKFSEVAKNTVLAYIIGSIVGLFLSMGAYILSMLFRLPGLHALRRVKAEEVRNMSDSIRGGSELKLTVHGGPVKGIVDDLREKMVEGLVGEGLTETIAVSMVHNRERLQYGVSQWDTLITAVKSMLSQGYSEFLVAAHLELSLGIPTAPRLDLIKAMFECGIEDHSLFQRALQVEGYGVYEFEEAIRLHDVEERTWSSALQSSFMKVAKC